MADSYHLPARLDRLQGLALMLGLGGLVLGAIGFFVSRAQFFNAYLVAWCGLTGRLCSESMQFERRGGFAGVRKMRKVSAFGLLALMVTVTLAAVDWVMSREPHFYSSIIGFMVAIGMTLSGLCFVTVLLAVLDDESDVLHFLTPNRLNDIGNLILTLVILWAYMSFAQFLIIWMGNIKTET